jgi:hypothetical protein
MAMDFPGQPTVGQVFTVGSIQYVWNGYAWAGGGSQPLPATTIVSDTPPQNARAGETWWESDTGILFMNYNDGNGPAQWVQINASIPSVPNDGNEYAWVNNAWRMVKQTLTPAAGSIWVDVPIPTWAKAVQIDGACFVAIGGLMVLRVSSDGTTFYGGASDYYTGGPFHQTTPTTYGVNAIALAPQINISASTDTLSVPILFRTMINVTRGATDQFFFVKSYTSSFVAASGYYTTWFMGNFILAAAGLRLAALRIFTSTTFNAGSQIHCRWL